MKKETACYDKAHENHVYIYYRSLSVHLHSDISAPSALPGPAHHARYLRNTTAEDDGERGSSRGLIQSLFIILSAGLSKYKSLSKSFVLYCFVVTQHFLKTEERNTGEQTRKTKRRSLHGWYQGSVPGSKPSLQHFVEFFRELQSVYHTISQFSF